MIEILDQSTGNVLAMRLSGKLLHRDYQQFVPMLEQLIEEHGSVRCFIEMTDFRGVELRALWDEIKFDVRHARQIERCAVVGDRTWQSPGWPVCPSRSSPAPKSGSMPSAKRIRRGSGLTKNSENSSVKERSSLRRRLRSRSSARAGSVGCGGRRSARPRSTNPTTV